MSKNADNLSVGQLHSETIGLPTTVSYFVDLRYKIRVIAVDLVFGASTFQSQSHAQGF